MKLALCLIAILACANYAQSAAAACASTSYCQSCGSGATTCSSCYSAATGDLKNKTWTTSTTAVCGGTIPTTWQVTDCLYNSTGFTASQLNPSTVVAVTNHPRCQVCNNKKYLHYANTATTETCTDTAPSTMTSCTQVTNCAQTVCKTDTTTAHYC